MSIFKNIQKFRAAKKAAVAAAAIGDEKALSKAQGIMAAARARGSMSNAEYNELKALVKANRGLAWEDFAETRGEADSLSARWLAENNTSAMAATLKDAA